MRHVGAVAGCAEFVVQEPQLGNVVVGGSAADGEHGVSYGAQSALAGVVDFAQLVAV